MATTWATDAEVKEVCPDIANAESGATYDNERTEAQLIIMRALEVGWWRREAGVRGIDWRDDDNTFDKANLTNAATQLKRAEIYKTLELLGMRYTRNEIRGDKWEKLRDYYHDAYQHEIEAVLNAGVDYDWDEDGTLEDTEKGTRVIPRLMRM